MVSRLLAILVTVLSIAFLGFALAVKLGGPNWDATARGMTAYQLTYVPGENAQWTATSADGESVGSSPVLPGVIVAALNDKIQKLQDQLNNLNERQPQVDENLTRLNQQIEADREALAAGIDDKRQHLAQLEQQTAQLSNQVIQQTAAGSAVEQVVSDRRSDVFRLQNQREVLRADEARIAQIHRQMADLIEQIDADLAKARRREQQLRSQLKD